jgi:hypothetical protein
MMGNHGARQDCIVICRIIDGAHQAAASGAARILAIDPRVVGGDVIGVGEARYAAHGVFRKLHRHSRVGPDEDVDRPADYLLSSRILHRHDHADAGRLRVSERPSVQRERGANEHGFCTVTDVMPVVHTTGAPRGNRGRSHFGHFDVGDHVLRFSCLLTSPRDRCALTKTSRR